MFRLTTARGEGPTLNSNLLSLTSPSPSCRPCRCRSLAPMNEFVNIKRRCVSHPPISVADARPSPFVGGENYFWQPRSDLFSGRGATRAARFTAFDPIIDCSGTPAASRQRGKLRGSCYSFRPSGNIDRFHIVGKFP